MIGKYGSKPVGKVKKSQKNYQREVDPADCK